MDFVKMHGLGNDFVITAVDSWDAADALQPWAQAVCDRRFGIGADGLVCIGRAQDADLFMRIFNPDGSEPEMCGNAIRCVGRYAFEKGWTESKSLSVLTRAGIRYPEVKVQGGRVESVTVDMGEPILVRELLPMAGTGGTVAVCLETSFADLEITAVSMGNPHCVIFVPDVTAVPVERWGPEIEIHPMFPAKTNVEFAQVESRNEITMRVWERGAGVTLACGTGTCATVVAAVQNGLTDRRVVVHLLGGDLLIEWREADNHVYMTGPAEEVFTGHMDLV